VSLKTEDLTLEEKQHILHAHGAGVCEDALYSNTEASDRKSDRGIRNQ
jgi:hypothetical protein